MNRRLAPMVANANTGDELSQFAATAAFALPEPYGILASGVISLLSGLFGGNDMAAAFARAMEQLEKELLQQIQLMLYYQTLRDAAGWIQTRCNGCTIRCRPSPIWAGRIQLLSKLPW